MNQVIQSATAKAVQELKTIVNGAREALLESLAEKVGKLSHSEAREVLALVCNPTKEEATTFVTKRTKAIIDELVEVAAVKAKPAKEVKHVKQKTNKPSLIDTNKAK